MVQSVMASNFPREALLYVQKFLRRPLEEIARLPDWTLTQVLVVHGLLALVSGVLSGFFPFGLWRVLQGLILFPILVSVMASLLSAFLYYYFQIFERRTVSYVKLFTLVAFSNLPFFLFHIPSALFPPSDLFGLAMASILLVIGLTENFGMEKRRSLRLVGLLFGLLFLLWLAEKVLSSRDRLPASLEQPLHGP